MEVCLSLWIHCPRSNGLNQWVSVLLREGMRGGQVSLGCCVPHTSDSQPGDFVPKGTLGNVWKCFWFSQWEMLLATSG